MNFHCLFKGCDFQTDSPSEIKEHDLYCKFALPLPKVHHIWCNKQSGPVDTCTFCIGAWRKYPYDPETATIEDIDVIVARNFPRAVAILGTGPKPGELIHCADSLPGM